MRMLPSCRGSSIWCSPTICTLALSRTCWSKVWRKPCADPVRRKFSSPTSSRSRFFAVHDHGLGLCEITGELSGKGKRRRGDREQQKPGCGLDSPSQKRAFRICRTGHCTIEKNEIESIGRTASQRQYLREKFGGRAETELLAARSGQARKINFGRGLKWRSRPISRKRRSP